jgi:hypothetical protein
MMGADPVGNGIVDGLARPGGNVTGITMLAAEVMQKCSANWCRLLRSWLSL